MSDGWVEVSFQVPAELVDRVTEPLIELSGCGVCIDNQILDTFSLDTLPEPSSVTLRTYFSDTPDLDQKIKEASRIVSSICNGNVECDPALPAIKNVHQEDWATSWKQHFHPSPVGSRLLLKPSWEDLDENNSRIVIEIDPGMAFGTGTHPTTRLCLETLERILDSYPPFDKPIQSSPPTILDVGTGSGVLSIAARKLGAGKIVAVDIDPEAVTVALENLHNNSVFDEIEVSTAPLTQINATFAVVLANILAEDLIRMAPELASKLMDKGVIVLSGILNEKEAGVMEAFAACGLTHLETTRQQEWSCIVFMRNQ